MKQNVAELRRIPYEYGGASHADRSFSSRQIGTGVERTVGQIWILLLLTTLTSTKIENSNSSADTSYAEV